MSETTERIRRAVDRAMELLRERRRSDVVSHTTLEHISGISRRDRELWVSFTVSLKQKHLRETGIELWNRWGEGYALLTAREQLVDVPEVKAKRRIQKTREARAAIEAIPAQELSDHERRIQAMRGQSLEQSEAEQRRQLKEMRLFARPEALPRPAVS